MWNNTCIVTDDLVSGYFTTILMSPNKIAICNVLTVVLIFFHCLKMQDHKVTIMTEQCDGGKACLSCYYYLSETSRFASITDMS